MGFSAQDLKALRAAANRDDQMTKKASALMLRRIGILQKNGQPTAIYKDVIRERTKKVGTKRTISPPRAKTSKKAP